jgi:hypothetical protein
LTGQVRGYYDYDLYFDKGEDVRERRNELFDEIMSKGDFQLFSNIRKTKNKLKLSIHAVSTEVCYEDARDIPDLQISVEHDQSVYSAPGKQQLFRLPYQMKETDETSILKMCVKQDTWIELEYGEIEMEDLFIQNIGGCAVVKHEEEIKHAPVSIPEEEPESDAVCAFANLLGDNRFNNMKEWMKMMRLFKNLNCPKLFDRLSSKYDNYRPGEVDRFMSKPDVGLKTLGMGTLRYWAKEDSPDKYEAVANQHKPPKQSKQQLLNYYINQPVKQDELKSVEYNVRYCDKKWLETDKTIFVRAQQGTGKTYATMQYVSDECKKNNDLRVIFNSFRVSLSQKYQSDFDKDYKHVGMTHYLEKRDGKSIKLDNSEKRLVLQMDSYSRLDWNQPPDVFVIDEVSQVRGHMVSKTYLKQPVSNLNIAKFKWCVKYAKQVICLDAALSKKDIDWIRYMRGGDHVVYENTYVQDNKNVSIIKDKHHLLIQAKEQLKHGKVYIACNCSKKSIDAYAEFLDCKNTILINSHTIDNDEVKRVLDDISLLENYDLVMVSPSIQSGVSYDKKGIFTVYGIFDNWTTLSNNTVQMIRRIRYPKSIYVSIDQSNHNISHWDTDDVLRKITMENNHAFEYDKKSMSNVTNININKTGNITLEANSIVQLYAEVCAESYVDKRNYTSRTINYLKLEGHEVNLYEYEETKELKRHISLVKKYISSIKKNNENMRNQALADLKEHKLSIDELMEKDKLTETERLSLEKQKINKTYNNIEPTEDSFYEIYNKEPIKNAFRANRAVIEYETNEEAILAIKKKELFIKMDSDNMERGISMIVNKKKYKKYAILLDMVDMMGFRSIYDDKEIKKDDLIGSLEQIKEKYFGVNMKDTCMLLNKRMKKTTESIGGDMKSKLRCINGGLSIFGISVKSKGREGLVYRINHKYRDMFHYDYSPSLPNIPNLRNTGYEDPIEEWTPEETSAAIDALVL